MPTTGQAKRFGSIVGVLVFAALAGACDGGGGSLGPLWVETDVIVADVDGDGRADVLTLAMLSDGGTSEGNLLVYRQAASCAVISGAEATFVFTIPPGFAGLSGLSVVAKVHDGGSPGTNGDTWSHGVATTPCDGSTSLYPIVSGNLVVH